MRNKKDRTIRIIPLAIFICFQLAAHGNAAILELNNQSAQKGKDVTFTVSVKAAPNAVNAFGFDLVYDAGVLRYKKSGRGSLVQKNFSFFGVNEISPGRVRVGGMEIDKNRIEKGAGGTLVDLTFEVIGSGKSDIKITSLKDNLKNWSIQNGHFIGGTNAAASREIK